VCILDADKEGFLRSSMSLVQTIGRAARNVDGKVILYADTITHSMREAIDETERRRAIQTAYNKAHGITPESIHKAVRNTLAITRKPETDLREGLSDAEITERIALLTEQMRACARELEFEQAAKLRDEIKKLSGEDIIERAAENPKPGTVGSRRKSIGRTRK
jgi:excinuclease ABC subunit B